MCVSIRTKFARNIKGEPCVGVNNKIMALKTEIKYKIHTHSITLNMHYTHTHSSRETGKKKIFGCTNMSNTHEKMCNLD